MSARDLTHFHNISWYSSLRHSTIHLITDDSTLALAQKSEGQHENVERNKSGSEYFWIPGDDQLPNWQKQFDQF